MKIEGQNTINSPIKITLTAAILVFALGAVLQIVFHLTVDDKLTDFESHLLFTIVITFLTAGVAWFFTRKLDSAYKDLEAARSNEERRKAHQATMFATYHYLNNALNQVNLLILQIESGSEMDQEVLEELKKSINKTSREIRELGEMTDVTKENVEKFINSRLTAS